MSLTNLLRSYPSEVFTLQRGLIEYVAHAFRQIQLGDGMTIYEGESRDRYGDPIEDGLALKAERIDWRRVPFKDLVERHCSLSFLDAKGLQFYTPAIMTMIVNEMDDRGLLTESFFFHIHDMRASCKVRDTNYFALYNLSQGAAIIRLVKYHIHNVRGGKQDDAMVRTLAKLFDCCQRSKEGV